MPITQPIPRLPNQRIATPATRTAQSNPLSVPIPSSLPNSTLRLPVSTCPSASPRITRVRVWLPAIPPMLATTGINTASATICSSAPWNCPITDAARKAVIRLQPSQTERRRVLVRTGANMSASSSRPAIPMIARSESSRMLSITSSTVMRPSRMPSSLVTAAESMSRSSNWRATSWLLVSTSSALKSPSITSLTRSSARLVTSRLRRSTPR